MTRIYKKPTHTHRYLNFYSPHSMSHKQGLVKCRLKRTQSQSNFKQANKTLKTSKIMKAFIQFYFLFLQLSLLTPQAILNIDTNNELAECGEEALAVLYFSCNIKNVIDSLLKSVL